MKCPACSQEISADAKFCQYCGAQLQYAAARKKNPERPVSSVSQMQPATEEHHGLPEDKTLWEGRFVPQAMYGYWALAALISLLTTIGLMYWQATSQAWWIAMICLGVLWVALLVLYWYRRVIVHYRLTNCGSLSSMAYFSRRLIVSISCTSTKRTSPRTAGKAVQGRQSRNRIRTS